MTKSKPSKLISCLYSSTLLLIFFSAFSARALDWPPVLGKPYPDLTLVDQDGNKLKLSSLKGSVLLIEPVGMTCAGCQGFSGGKKYGGFGGVQPQGGLDSIEDYLKTYGGGTLLKEGKVILVQILLYSLTMKAPTPEDARNWAKHFHFETKNHQYVLAGTPDLIGNASYQMIPGFQLVDKNFILRWDSTGHQPRHNLYTQLLPQVPVLAR